MKIIEIIKEQMPKSANSDIYWEDARLVVEMTQEEYMLSCHAVIEAQKQQSTKK